MKPWSSSDSTYKTSKAHSEEIVLYFSGGTNLNYVGHRYCVCGESAGARKEREYLEMVEIT